jgi:hypothetical protein
LSGTFHGLIGASGNEQHPFVVEVVGTVIGSPLHVKTELDLRAPETFISSIFGEAWADLKKTLSWMLDHVAQMSLRGSRRSTAFQPV